VNFRLLENCPAHRVKQAYLRPLLELRLPSSGHRRPQPAVLVGAQTRRVASRATSRARLLDQTVAPGAACSVTCSGTSADNSYPRRVDRHMNERMRLQLQRNQNQFRCIKQSAALPHRRIRGPSTGRSLAPFVPPLQSAARIYNHRINPRILQRKLKGSDAQP
jgi:hypothetical protein